MRSDIGLLIIFLNFGQLLEPGSLVIAEMLANGFSKYLCHSIRVLSFLQCFPFEFDSKAERLIVTQNKFKRHFSVLVFVFDFVYFFFTLSVVYNVASFGCVGKTAEGTMINIVIVLMLLWSVDVKPNLMAMSVLNSCLKFEENFKGLHA